MGDKMQKLGKYVGFGAAGKLEWVCFKLNFKQEELARLRQESAARPNGAMLFSTISASQTMRANETTQQKMERMIAENPPALEAPIRQVYQALMAAEQRDAH